MITAQWVRCGVHSTTSHFQIPNDAILAGKDADGSPIYVGRANHERDQLVAKVIPNRKYVAVSFHGKEIRKHKFEVLCHGNVQWVPACDGQVVCNAVLGGLTVRGEVLYIGRGHHKGSLTVGKIHQSHGCLYIPFDGLEIAIKSYEVLVEN